MLGHKGPKLFLLIRCKELPTIQLVLGGFLLDLALEVPDFLLLGGNFGLIGTGLPPELPQLHLFAEELVPQGAHFFGEDCLPGLDLELLIFCEIQGGCPVKRHTCAQPHSTPASKRPTIGADQNERCSDNEDCFLHGFLLLAASVQCLPLLREIRIPLVYPHGHISCHQLF